MPYLPTAQAWLKQSTLLLEARPTTTRITTKYTLTPPSQKSKSRATKPPKEDPAPTSTASAATDAPTAVPPVPTTRATLTLKTYDTKSGTTLKYQTDKAAEVGRLISSLSQLGRGMAGLPELKNDANMLDAGTGDVIEATSRVATPVGGDVGLKAGATGTGVVQASGVQGSKKGKKKGKK